MCAIEDCTREIVAAKSIQSKDLSGHRAEIGGTYAFSRLNKIDKSI